MEDYMDLDIDPRRPKVKRMRAAGSEAQKTYQHWKMNQAPLMYDMVISKKLPWPSPVFAFGGSSLDGMFLSNDKHSPDAVYMDTKTFLIAERTAENKEANTLLLLSTKIPKQHLVRVADFHKRWSDNPRDAFSDFRVLKRLIHPGEVNRACVLGRNYVVSHTDSKELFVWDMASQPHRKEQLKDAPESVPDFILVGHKDIAPYALDTTKAKIGDTKPDLLVASGDASGEVLVWHVPLTTSISTASAGEKSGTKTEMETDFVSESAAILQQQIGKASHSNVKAAKTIHPLVRFGRHEGTVNDVSLAPDSISSRVRVMSVSDDKTFAIWDSRAGKDKPTSLGKKCHSNFEADCCAWNPIDMNLVASGGHDFLTKVWDVRALLKQNGEPNPLKEFHGHRDGVMEVRWNPMNKDILASASKDSTVIIWDTSRSKEDCIIDQGHFFEPEHLFTHNGHQCLVNNIDWCPSDPWCLASICEDNELASGGGTVQIWRIIDYIYKNPSST